ncbi:MAG: hypothetical protein M3Y03_07200, partial [Verrucomicrobiota bacterium]|nr:hypothetical protein [Verrucomicrobiota bacterium]
MRKQNTETSKEDHMETKDADTSSLTKTENLSQEGGTHGSRRRKFLVYLGLEGCEKDLLRVGTPHLSAAWKGGDINGLRRRCVRTVNPASFAGHRQSYRISLWLPDGKGNGQPPPNGGRLSEDTNWFTGFYFLQRHWRARPQDLGVTQDGKRPA